MWNAVPPVVIALIAGGVSLVVTVLTNRATSRSASRQAQQTQFKEVIAKRMEVYPRLWRIHIHYETNWTLNTKPKTREYVDALNEFNLDGGLFFSQDLYKKFVSCGARCTKPSTGPHRARWSRSGPAARSGSSFTAATASRGCPRS